MFGIPEQNGLCDDCYRKKGRRHQSASSAAGASNHQGSSISGNFHSTQATAQNRQFSSSSAQPRSFGLQDPVQDSQPQSPSYESGMARQNSNAGNDAFYSQKCRGTNCTLFGTPETNGYCSRCFLESTIPQSYPHSIPGNYCFRVSIIIITCNHLSCINVLIKLPFLILFFFFADFRPRVSSQAVASNTTEKCVVTGCANLASPERHGHCQTCFTRFYPEVIHRETVELRQTSALAGSIN